MGGRAIRWMTMVVVLGTAWAAHADTLELKDGRKLNGRLIRQTVDEVVFEAHKYGAKMVLRVSADQVVSVKLDDATRPPAEPKPQPTAKVEPKPDPAAEIGDALPPEPEAPPVKEYDTPTYYRIPLHGEVGKSIIAKALEQSLADAMQRKPTVVVLDVESPGGLVSEVQKIVDVIRQHNPRMRIVAWCGKSLSAAAVLSMATQEIYMKPTGTIGAATAYQMTVFGLPQAIEEKMQSAWRATARSAAETGGHEPLLAEAMIDSELALHWVEQDGRKVVHRGDGSHTITKKGRLLTMTANEAVECGLARGKAKDIAELAGLLGVGMLTECKGLGTLLSDYWVQTIEALDEELKRFGVEFREDIQRAESSHPSRHNYTYYQNTKKLTAQSQRIWHRRSVACASAYRQAQKNVERAIEMTKRFDHMEPVVKRLEQLRLETKAKADTVYSLRNNFFVGRDR